MFVIDPLTRVEGHSRLTIYIQEGRVVDVKFNAVSLRAFEKFIQGADAKTIPIVVARICGVCSTAHHIAAAKALENAFDVTPPERAVRVRELMMLGQTIESHAMSLYFLALPDFYQQKASIFELMDVDPDLNKQATTVRRAGTQIIWTAGKRGIHPTNATIGGVYKAFDERDAERLDKIIDEGLKSARSLLDTYWHLFTERREEILSTAATPTYYITAVHPDYSFYGNDITIAYPDGKPRVLFTPAEIPAYLTLDTREESFAPVIHFGGEVIRANSLARMNILRRYGTPIADRYVEHFAKDWGLPAHQTLLFDLARGIEIIFCLERAKQLLPIILEEGDLLTPFRLVEEGTGIGVVEAPRGVLYHEYHVEKGLIKSAEFYIPTQHNLLALERAIYENAKRYVAPEGIDMRLETETEKIVRAFDICVSCATHSLEIVRK